MFQGVYSIQDGFSSDDGGEAGEPDAPLDSVSVDIEPMLGAPPPYAYTPPPYEIMMASRKGSNSSDGTQEEKDTLISDSDRCDVMTLSNCTEITIA